MGRNSAAEGVFRPTAIYEDESADPQEETPQSFTLTEGSNVVNVRAIEDEVYFHLEASDPGNQNPATSASLYRCPANAEVKVFVENETFTILCYRTRSVIGRVVVHEGVIVRSRG